MATTAKADKSTKKKEKHRRQQQEEDDAPGAKDDSMTRKQKQKPRPAAEAATAERKGENDKDRTKRANRKEDKKIKINKKKKQQHDQHNHGGDPERNAEKNSLVTDARFVSVHSDPKFQIMPRREKKVPIDNRFVHMLSDESFGTSSAPVDKRGKSRKRKAENPLINYYLFDQEVKQEPLWPEDGNAKVKVDEPSSYSEEKALVEEDFSSQGSDANASSTDEEDDDEDDQCSVRSDIVQYLMASHKDTPTVEHETYRLAVVNMDWEHIKAVDLFVVINSCLPQGGQILSVSIYPTEFGLTCMEVEEVHGPSGLFDDDGEHSEDGSEIDDEKFRTYELNKLRYYYAVVVCDSSATANHIYKILDGTELLKTSNVFDLRFIPDSMEFIHPPRDITKEAPTSYKEPDFETRALQHSKVKLTWEEDEPHRTKILRRKFNPNQLDEFKEYLASSGNSDDDDRVEDENDRKSDDSESEGKKRIDREKLLSLLQPEDESDANHSDDKDMEVTFNTGLEDLSKRILEKKIEGSETVWEAVLRKKSEKKKSRKKRSKYSSEDDSSDFDIQETPDQPDDFFVEDPVGTDAKPSSLNKGKRKARGKKSGKGREQSPEINKEQEASKAELELLFADNEGADHGPKGYNMKPKKVKGKKGKEMPAEDKLPNVEYKEDSRFKDLLTSHLFALDPTDPQFKRSTAYAKQRSRKEGAGARGEEEEESTNPSEQVRLQSDDMVPKKDGNLHPAGVSSSEKERHDFSSTVRSLKRNLVTRKTQRKGR